MKKPLGFLAVILLIFLPLAIYMPSLQGDFIWDDDAHITHNPTIQNPGGLGDIWFKPGSVPQYYPVVHTAFWAQYQLWGLEPFGYRAINALLHGVSCLLVWLILRKLAVPGALLAAAVFAVHPVHVESVAWISELKNVLSGFLYLAAMLAYLKFASPLNAPLSTALNPRWRWGLYALAMVLFLAAILSKSVTCTLPAALTLILWWKRDKWDWRDLAPLAPMFAIGIGMGMVTIYVEKHFIGAQGTHFNLSPLDRLIIAGRALTFYTGKIFWPWELIFFYPRWIINAGSPLQHLFPLGALAVMVTLVALHKRIGKAPAVGVLFFAGTLLPALGFFDVYPFIYSYVADHFQYLASLGLIALGCGGATWLVHRFLAERAQLVGVIAGVLLVAVLGIKSSSYSRAFTSLEALYGDVIAKNPRAWMAMNNLGSYYIGQKQYDQALPYITESIQVNPHNDRAHNNMAVLHRHYGKKQDAIGSYKRSVSINDTDSHTLSSLGQLLVEYQSYEEAKPYLLRALAISPELTDAKRSLAKSYMMTGSPRQSIVLYRELLDEEPKNPSILTGLAEAFTILGNHPEAIRQYRQSLEIDPRQPEANNNIATLLIQNGRNREAVGYYRAALQDRPGMHTARRNLALTLTHLGRTAEAVTEYRQILLADPRDVPAIIAVADAEVESNDLKSAYEGYQQAIRLDPLNAEAFNKLGWVQLLLNQDKQALESITFAIKLAPDLVDGWFNMGQLQLKQQQYDQAATSFDHVLKLNPKYGLASFQRGWIHEIQNQEQAAITCYRTAIELMPRSPDAMERLAWILATAKDPALQAPEEAITLAKQAARLTRNQRASTLDTLSAAYAASRQYPQAVSTARHALRVAKAQGETALEQEIAARLKTYEALRKASQ